MTRAQYQSCICEYKRRRYQADIKYMSALKSKRNITYKINSWQRAIKRIDAKNKKIKELVKKVNYYFNVNIESISMDLKHKLARSIFYKIGMENKMRGKNLAEYIGRSKRSAFRNRVSLTQSFRTKPENQKAFYDFKKYISE